MSFSFQMRSSGSKELETGEEPRTYGDKLRDLSNLANSLSAYYSLSEIKIRCKLYYFKPFYFFISDCSMSQLAVAWCLKNESVNSLLIGASSVEQFKENIHALQVNK
jgi:hypothetical protein